MRNAICQPLLLAVVLAIGLGVVWGGFVGWGVALVDQASHANRIREQILVRPDGTPVIRWYPNDNYRDVTDRTLAGEPLPEPAQNALPFTNLSGPPDPRQPSFRLGWYQRIASFHDDRRPPAYWYFIHDGRHNGSGYFAGYHSRSKRLAGYIGLGGFRTSKPPKDDCFEVDAHMMGYYGIMGSSWSALEPRVYPGSSGDVRFPSWIVYVPSQNRLWEVDLQKHSVRIVSEFEELVSAGSAFRVPESSKPKGPGASPPLQRSLALRQRDRILVLGPGGEKECTYPLPAEIRDATFKFYQLSDYTAIVHLTRNSTDGVANHTLLWIDRQGKIVRREKVTTGQPSALQTPGCMARVLALAVPVPAITTPIAIFGFPLAYLAADEAPDYPTAMRKAFSVTWPALLVLNLLGAALAWWCYRRQKQFGQPRVWAWVVFVFLFGVPALLAYLFHRGWPVRETCPSCSRPAPRDRQACFSCGEELPEPSRRGTEVLV